MLFWGYINFNNNNYNSLNFWELYIIGGVNDFCEIEYNCCIY